MPKSLQIRQAISEAKEKIRIRTKKALRRLAREQRTAWAYAYIRSLNPPPEVPEEKIRTLFVSVGTQTEITFLEVIRKSNSK